MKTKLSILLCLMSLTVMAPPSPNTGSVFVYFNFPPPPPDFSHYILYYGTSSSNYSVAISTGSATNYTINGLQRGQTYYFNVTQRTRNEVESDYTDEASVTIPTKPPKGNSIGGK